MVQKCTECGASKWSCGSIGTLGGKIFDQSKNCRIAQLEQLLRDYGGHGEGCEPGHCRCGWAEVEKRLSKGGG